NRRHRSRLLVGVQAVPFDEARGSEAETQTVAHGATPVVKGGLKPLGNEPETAGKPILSRTRPEDNPRFVHSQDRGAAQTRLRSHPSNLIRVIPAKGGTIPERAPAWGITPVPNGCAPSAVSRTGCCGAASG